MTHVDNCLSILSRLIATGDTNAIPMAENAIEEYWAATPPRARKSGLLYIQQMLLDQPGDPNSRELVVTINAFIEKKLIT